MTLLPVSNARDVGECIYCGSKEAPLQREHAVPFGLNGDWTLLRASCKACEKITTRFERDTLKGLWPALRIALSMRSRRGPHPDMLPLVIEAGGVQRTEQVRRDEFPVYLPSPIFPAPGYVTGVAAPPDLTPELRFLHIAGPSFEQVAQRYAADYVGARVNFAPSAFARTLAKIAFCAGVCAVGLAPFKQTPIRRVILGTDPDFGRLIGTWTGAPMNERQGLHAIQVRASGTDIHVVMRLFAQFGAPEYHVVLGPADPSFVASPRGPQRRPSA